MHPYAKVCADLFYLERKTTMTKENHEVVIEAQIEELEELQAPTILWGT